MKIIIVYGLRRSGNHFLISIILQQNLRLHLEKYNYQ